MRINEQIGPHHTKNKASPIRKAIKEENAKPIA